MDIAQLESAVELFYLEKQRYPTNDEGFSVFVEKTDSHPAGLISEAPVDPRGLGSGATGGEYAQPGEHGLFDIVSFGRDASGRGGEGDDADIGSWELGKE